MSKNIDAGSAKLAGLQMDTLSKYRAGQITLDQWERFNNLTSEDREARFGDWKNPAAETPDITGKFAVLVDLGIITVPDDYVHASQLKTFGKKNRKKFCDYDNAITDKNYPNPTRVLKPGDRLHVRTFHQIFDGTTTSEERMAFLSTQRAVHAGAQGASLVFDQKRDQLPKGKWYASFDEKDRLWKNAGGYHGVPYVGCDFDCEFEFCLGCFEYAWYDSDAFFGFCEVVE